MATRIAVIYSSSTGHVHQLAEAVGEGAEAVGAVSDEVREAARYQGRRLAEYAERLVASREPAAA